MSNLGKARIAETKRTKEELDPKKILSPGMWLEPPLLFKPEIYQFAMSIASIMDKILPTRAGKVKAGKRESDRVS